MFNEDSVWLCLTDTVWGIGCDGTREDLVARIYKIKKRDESKSLVILVSSLEMLERHVEKIPVRALEEMKRMEKPTTIIYDNPIGIAKNAIGKDNTVAIRLVLNHPCKKAIEKFGKPVIATSANISEEPLPNRYSEINPAILNAVDYVLNSKCDRIYENPSRIIKITNQDQIIVIRP